MRFLYLILGLVIIGLIWFLNFTEQTVLHSIIGIIAGVSFARFYYAFKFDKYKAYERKCEKLSVTKESDSSRVFALEAKIQTLEKALEKALQGEKN